MGKTPAVKSEDKAKQSELAGELLLNGTVTIKAATREELFAKFNEVKASAKDVIITAGAVGHSSDTGTFSLRVDINRFKK